MAKIAYILLCHKDPDAIVEQARRLTDAGDCVAIHFDRRASEAEFARIAKQLADNSQVTFTPRRYRCGWGEWSLVKATLAAVRAAQTAFPEATHFYLLSGDCMPIKSAEYMHDFLDGAAFDFIESEDFHTSAFIQTGLREERLHYRHFFNEREQKRLFYASLEIQKKLGLARGVPDDIDVMIGSQWWCLRRETIERVLSFVKARPDVVRYFSTTWIPDETFFQTIVRHVVPAAEVQNRTLTFLMFTDYGMPATFYNDHYDLLVGQDAFFARKISAEAQELKTQLGALYASRGTSFDISNDGHAQFAYMTRRGRTGRRYAPRFWENGATLGRDRELMIVVCKKWHVAKRLLAGIRQESDIPCIEYLFNEENTPLPDLGGIEKSLKKMTRHRRALMRLLFGHFQSDRIVICIDPADLDVLRDFASDKAKTRILEIRCQFSDAYLAGHAQRVGLIGPQSSQNVLEKVLPTLRNDIRCEHDQIMDENFSEISQIREGATNEENAAALADFLSLSRTRAQTILTSPGLFSD